MYTTRAWCEVPHGGEKYVVPMHDYTKNEIPVNNLFEQYVMLKNAIREMGGYKADQLID